MMKQWIYFVDVLKVVIENEQLLSVVFVNEIRIAVQLFDFDKVGVFFECLYELGRIRNGMIEED